MKLLEGKNKKFKLYIGYAGVLTLYFIFAFTAKFPLLAAEKDRATLIQSGSIGTILLHLIIITAVYFLATYFIPFKDLAGQLKSYQQPLRDTMDIKFELWLKSLLHEDVLKEHRHINEVEKYINERAIGRIDVLKRAAELNDMTTETFIKLLKGQAEANFINAKGETEKAKAELLKEAVQFISKMTPMWQAYTITAIFGSQPSGEMVDLDLKKEFEQVLKNLKEEELRGMKNKNTYDEHRNKQKMKPDV